ncbi:MAG: glycoside hydrolase family 2 TIM barrel-domain containing protein [Terracidiphilus sp.]
MLPANFPEQVSSPISRREALKGIGAISAMPLLAQPERDENRAKGQANELAAGSSRDRDHLFDLDWRFLRADVSGAESPDFDDAGWRIVDLPHDWSIEDLDPGVEPSGEGTIWVGGSTPTRVGPFDVARSAGQEATGWVVGGTAWYRKRFRVDLSDERPLTEIRFDGVYMNSEVWINGHSLGRHPYGYTPFAYDLTTYLNAGGENVIAVCVRNEGANSRWYSGSGIYRHVWLTQTSNVRIPLYGVGVTTSKISRERAEADVSVTIENRSKSHVSATVRTRVLDPDGKPVADTAKEVSLAAGELLTVTSSNELADPHLWSARTPKLYRAEVEVVVGGKTVDHSTVTFGIRSIEVDLEHGLRINGETVKLKGGCVHHDNGILGSAAFDRAEERRVEVLNANGFDAIRTSHNPPSPAFLDACDRLGMYVIDEAFDCWNLGKWKDDYHLYFNDWWERDLNSMLMRDRNHPSIVFWSIGNEIDGRREQTGVAIAKRLHDAVKAIDTSRPVTMAVPGPYDHNLPEWQANDPAFLHLDVGGYNYQWQQYEIDHKRLPDRIMMGTESFPVEACDSWRSAERLSYVLGDFVWTAIDYIGEAAIGHTVLSQTPAWWRQQYPWFNAYCGDIDLIGDKKPQSYYRDVLWGQSKLEMAVQRPLPEGRTEELSNWGWTDELRSWTWPGYEGFGLKVHVYTSGDLVRLYLDGKKVGVRSVSPEAKLLAQFDVPYAAGELRAVAFRDGNQIASISFRTLAEPSRLKLSVDRQVIRASRGDLAFVHVEITDGSGEPIPDLIRRIDFQVDGAGELAAVGNANPKDVASFREPHCRTFRGKCLAILRPLGRTGAITLRASAEGLASASIAVKCS